MINRRYFLVILDPSGRSVRRVGVSRRALEIVAGVALTVTVATGALFLHGLMNAREARETIELERENELLRQLSKQMTARLPAGRALASRAELTFAQLWTKTGLGLEPNVLGVGPLDVDALPSPADTPDSVLTVRGPQSHVLAVEPGALPLELDRLETAGQNLQTELGEMLEYFHDAAQLLQNTPSVRPVVHGVLTSSFGRRSDPYNHDKVMHKGVDLGGMLGAPVLAPADGVIIFAGIRGGYGLTVVVDHGYGIQTHYAHLSAVKVKLGQRVLRGDAIAAVGSSGRSTGPHLHYEVRRAGQPLNPLRFILD